MATMPTEKPVQDSPGASVGFALTVSLFLFMAGVFTGYMFQESRVEKKTSEGVFLKSAEWKCLDAQVESLEIPLEAICYQYGRKGLLRK